MQAVIRQNVSPVPQRRRNIQVQNLKDKLLVPTQTVPQKQFRSGSLIGP